MKKVVLESPADTEILIQGKRFVYFGGTNYLGMAARPEVLVGAKEAIDSYGLSSAASRTSTGTTALHLELEDTLASFAGTEDAVVLSSGYLSMQCLLEGIAEDQDFILLQRSAHPSIQQAVVHTGLPFQEFGFNRISDISRFAAEQGRVLLVAEGIAPLTGEILPLAEIVAALGASDFRILIDDAHGLGVAGNTGKGTLEYLACENNSVVRCATLSKAFGAFGGCVLPEKTLGDRIRSRSLAYICASPPSAADLGAALAAIRLLVRQPEVLHNLRSNVARVKEGLDKLGLPAGDTPIPIVPIVLHSGAAMEQLSDKLRTEGILAPYINYPGSPEGGLIRLAVTAAHTEPQLEHLLESLARLL